MADEENNVGTTNEELKTETGAEEKSGDYKNQKVPMPPEIQERFNQIFSEK